LKTRSIFPAKQPAASSEQVSPKQLLSSGTQMPPIQPSGYRKFTKPIILATHVLKSSLMRSGHCWFLGTWFQVSGFTWLHGVGGHLLQVVVSWAVCARGVGSRLMDMQRGAQEHMGDAMRSNVHCLLLTVDVMFRKALFYLQGMCAPVLASRHTENKSIKTFRDKWPLSQF